MEEITQLYKEFRTIDGIGVCKVYFINGIETREDGPSHIRLNPKNRLIVRESWRLNGEFHRSNGLPANIKSKMNGDVVLREFYEHGKRTRPAIRGVAANLEYDGRECK